MDTWKPDRLLKVLLSWTACTFIVFWLPAVRGLFDGPTYTWGVFGGLGGSGTSGDYWFPVLGSIAAIAILYLGWRGAQQPFAWLLLGWHLSLAAGALWLASTQPESFRFRGDTLGVDFSLAWAGPILFGGFAVLAGLWVARNYRNSRSRRIPSWNERNTRLMWLVVGIIPLQFILLRYGQPHGTTDQIGVLLTLAQWGLLNAALFPWPAPEKIKADVAHRSAPAD
ncbi:MAG: hypothetical protein J7555_11110 [Chloroflexi bacterium]|jgi:hypothetical protein|nr:hypothetical protein [Chloroflexota bacterium]